MVEDKSLFIKHYLTGTNHVADMLTSLGYQPEESPENLLTRANLVKLPGVGCNHLEVYRSHRLHDSTPVKTSSTWKLQQLAGSRDFFSSQLVLNLNKSRFSSIELIPLPQFMLKISTHPYVQGNHQTLRIDIISVQLNCD
ncbi:hypothetical protein KY290_008517 [Solanum tuberosum]|uniref:Uncharacterized protein n=1 Tax=Solanum tuberosum TaxID=4113 RepID=A0ABQ7W9Z2_SOLTU|nr:hypothetical protein KY290_008517 [Solanum tuberosum]